MSKQTTGQDRIRAAMVGLGRVGHACVQEAAAHPHLALAGIVRHAAQGVAAHGKLRVASHVRELGPIDLALLCVPPQHVVAVAHDLMQQGIRVVECAQVHGAAYEAHKRELSRLAAHFRTPVAVGAGWDPGALSLFRSLFALLVPHGHTSQSRQPGVALHHSTVGATTPGVRKAMTAERRRVDGTLQRYVYVELNSGAAAKDVTQAIRGDPLFAGDDTFVFPVRDITELEDCGHGALLERTSTRDGHARVLLEARYDEATLAARVMVAAAQALPREGARAYSLLDLPLASLWGEAHSRVEQEWM